MEIYKQTYFSGKINNSSIMRLGDNATIPFAPDNTDYANFKRHLQGLDENGNSITPVDLQDADGNTMSPEEVAEFLSTLP